MTVTVNATQTPSFTQVQPICSGGSFTLPTMSNNGIAGTWSPAINNMMTTTYTFTPNAAMHPCASTATMTVTVNATQTPSFTQVQPICSGGSFTLPTMSNNGIAGTWSPAINNMMTTTYTFTPNAALHPCAATEMMTVTVNANTTPTFTQVQPICSGGSFTLPTMSNNGIAGTWSPAINNTTTTLYTFTPNAAMHPCASTATMTVTVNANTTPTFTQVQPICSGGSFTLPTMSNNGIAGTWSPAINNMMTTTYTFTPNAALHPCAATEMMTVTVNANTTPTFTQVQPICSGGSFTLPTMSNNGIAGTWSPAINNMMTTTYTFTPNAALHPCAATEMMTVTVNANPTANVPAPFEVCVLLIPPTLLSENIATVISQITGGNPGLTVNWFFDAAATMPIPNINNVFLAIPPPTTVYATVSNGSCSSSTVPVGIVISQPPVINDPGNVSACQSYTLLPITGANLTGNEAYYTGPNGTGTQFLPGQVITSTITLFAYAGSGSCSDQEQFTITITPPPTAIAPGAPLSICDNGAGVGQFNLTNLNNIISGGSGTVNWFTDAGATNPIANPSAFVSGATTVYATVTVGTCSSSPVPLVLQLTPGPAANPAGPLEACDNGVGIGQFNLTNLNGIISGGSGTVNWFSNPAGTISIPSPNAYSSSSGTVYATVSNGNCTSQAVPVSLQINPLPVVNLTVAQAISCAASANGAISTTIGGATGPFTFDWNINALDGQQNPANLGPGTYSVVVTATATGCMGTGSITLSAPTAITLNCAQQNPVSTAGGSDGSATVQISGGTAAYTVAWSGAASGSQNQAIAGAATITGLIAGLYNVTVTDNNGCTQSCSFTIDAPNCPPISSPGIAVPTATICAGAAIPAFTASVPAGLTVIWYDAATGGTVLLANSLSFTPTIAGTYFAEAFDPVTGCRSATRTPVVLTINPTQTPSFTQVQPICAGASLSLPATSDNGIAGTWSPAVNNMATTTYTFTPNAALHPCAVTTTMTVQVDAQPTLTIGAVACAADLLTYSVSFTAMGGTVSATAGMISGSSVTGIPAGTNLTITVSNGTNTACDVSQNVTAPNCNCPPTAAPSIAVPTDTICAGAAIPAFTASVPAGLTVIWYDAATGGTVLLANNLSFTPTIAGTYFAEAFDPVTGCRSATRTQATLTIDPTQTPVFTQLPPICAGGTFSLPATSNNGIAGTWSPALNNMATTTYTFTPNAALHPCAVTATMTVQVDAQPTLTIGTVTCASDLLTYSVSFTAMGGTVSATAGTISGSSVTGIPAGTNVTITASNGTNTACDVSQNVTAPNCNCPPTAAPSIAVPTASICAGDAIPAFTASVPAGLTVIWYDAATGGMVLLANSLSFTPTMAGTYFAEAFDPVTGCGSATRTPVVLTINPTQTPTFTQVQPICAGGSFSLPATSGNGIAGTWSPAVNNTATTTYTFTPNAAAHPCAVQATMTVTVNPTQTPTFTQVQAICAGGSFSLPATSGNGIAGTWSPAVNNTATTTYTFTPNAAAHPCAVQATMTVTVNPTQTPTFTQVQPICAGGSFSLPATSSNGIAGTWSPAVNNTATTTYTFTPNAAAHPCAVQATMTVTVNPTQTPTFTQVQPICAGGSFSLPATSGNGIAGTWSPAVNNTATTTYTFTPNAAAHPCAVQATMTVTVNPTQTPTFTQVQAICAGGSFSLPATSGNGIAGTWSPAVNNTATTTYTFTPNAAAHPCAVQATMTVTVNPTQTPTFTQVQPICAGGSFSLPATSGNGIAGTWSPAVNNTATTTYTFTPNAAAHPCAVQATMTVTVNPTQTPTFTQVQAICAGGSFSLPATSSNGIAGTWSPAVNNTATTTYTFTPNAAAHPCAVQATMTVTVNPTQTPTFTQVQPICAGGSFSLPATSGNGIAGTWSPAVNNMATTTYTFTPNAAAHPCAVQATMTVQVDAQPTLTIGTVALAPDLLTYSVNFTATGGTVSTTAGTISGSTVTGIPTGTNVTITVSNGTNTACDVSQNVTSPNCNLSATAVGTNPGCNGAATGSIALTVTGGTGMLTFDWNDNSLDGIEDPSGLLAGAYSVTVTDGAGCTATASVTLTNPAALVFAAMGIAANCLDPLNGSISITLAGGGTSPYEVSYDGRFFIGLGALPAQIAGVAPGNYTVTLQDANDCMIETQVTVLAAPTYTLDLGPDQYIRLGDSVRLEGLANFAIDSVVWTPTEFLNDISGPVTYARPGVSTAYRLIAFNANGCRAEDVVWVYVDRRQGIFIPNAFSPNDDGINDNFRIFGDNSVQIIRSFHVFDRWGGNVFSATNVAPDADAARWNGRYRGQMANAGVYVYIAEIEFFDGHVETVMGEVTLLR
jgi:gliding motility-associated-like protein